MLMHARAHGGCTNTIRESALKVDPIQTTFFQFHGTLSLELTASHSKKCTSIVPVPISPKNLLVSLGFPAESSSLSEKRCLCVAVKCRWMHMNGGGGGGGGG